MTTIPPTGSGPSVSPQVSRDRKGWRLLRAISPEQIRGSAVRAEVGRTGARKTCQ